MILFLNRRLGLFSSLFSSGLTLSTPLLLLLLLLLLLSLILLLLTNLVGIEVVFLILLVVLSIEGSRMLKFSFKPRTGSRGFILGRSASLGSLSTPVDTAWEGFVVFGGGNPVCAV
jgi:hypothetical protein